MSTKYGVKVDDVTPKNSKYCGITLAIKKNKLMYARAFSPLLNEIPFLIFLPNKINHNKNIKTATGNSSN